MQELLSHTTNEPNWRLRSGHCARQALAVGEAKGNSSRPTVVRPLYACARSRDAMVRKLTRTHFCPSVGKPAMSSLTISLQLLFYRWTFFSSAGRPPPGLRTRSVGRPAMPAANSRRPRRIVLVHTGNLRQPFGAAMPDAGFQRYVPAPLLFVEPTQKDIHAMVVLFVCMGLRQRHIHTDIDGSVSGSSL